METEEFMETVPEALLVPVPHREHLVRQERQACLAPTVRQGLPDLPEATELEERLERTELPVPPAPRAPQALAEFQVTRRRSSLACPDLCSILRCAVHRRAFLMVIAHLYAAGAPGAHGAKGSR